MKVRFKIHPHYTETLRDLVKEIAENGVYETAECIYKGRNTLHKLSFRGINLNIKSFRHPSGINKYVYTNLRKSKARRSYENALTLLDRGVSTPQPIAWIERKKGACLKESYYISLHSPYPNTLRNWENLDAEIRDKVLSAYAKFLLHIHKQGISHHDMSPGNILWEERNGEIRFDVVDLNRMSLKNQELPLSLCFSNFRNINLVEEETRRLGEIYGRMRNLPDGEGGQRAVRALRKDRRKKRRLHALKAIFQRKKESFT